MEGQNEERPGYSLEMPDGRRLWVDKSQVRRDFAHRWSSTVNIEPDEAIIRAVLRIERSHPIRLLANANPLLLLLAYEEHCEICARKPHVEPFERYAANRFNGQFDIGDQGAQPARRPNRGRPKTSDDTIQRIKRMHYDGCTDAQISLYLHGAEGGAGAIKKCRYRYGIRKGDFERGQIRDI